MGAIVSIATLLLLAACSSDTTQQLSLTVQPQPYVHDIPAEGELQAADSTTVSSPGGGFPPIIEWIEDSNTPVEAGDILVTFDARQYLETQDEQSVELEKLRLELAALKRDLERQLAQIEMGKDEVSLEKEVATTYNPDDTRYFSRNEIIDALNNIAYLEAQESYFGWKEGAYESKAGAETGVLDARAASHKAKLAQSEAGLERLEIRAPHSGVFVQRPNWSGEYPTAGQMAWPGMVLGELPDLSAMDAKLYVLESEAAGLEVGQTVTVRLKAYPDTAYSGTVKTVAAAAKPIDRDSPVKYFEVIVALDETDTEIMIPGRKVSARIQVMEDEAAIALPNQVIHRDAGSANGQGGHYVYVLDGDEPVRRQVTIRHRGPMQSVIGEGLEEGERVAMVAPDTEIEDGEAPDQQVAEAEEGDG